MSGVLLAVPVVPLLAAMAILILSLRPVVAARVAIIASGIAFVAAAGTLVAVGFDGTLDLVATNDDGQAIVGLTANRVGTVLIALTTAVGLVVQSFAARSLRGDPRARRFHMLALVLTSATTLVAITATAAGLVIAWIATSAALVALVGHRAPWRPAVAARRRTGWSFAIGDSALVLAVVVTLVLVGSIDMRAIAAAELDAEQIGGVSALSIVAVLLVVAGVARSALIPIHRWLPSTLAAPTPVSALLHAGVVNGAGVLLIRFSPIFGSSVSAMSLAFVVGVATALIATAVMLVRTDVKGGLVWSTSGQMGFMVVQLGVGAFAAALFHIVGHALYKATMFLGAGDAISARIRQAQRPHMGATDRATLTSIPVRLGIGLAAPLASFALAIIVIDPHLSAAATMLVVVFGTLSIGRAADGWMSSAPLPTAKTVLGALAGVVAGVFGYVAGLTVFENFVVDVVPYDVPAAVGPVWVAGTLLGLAGAVAFAALMPGDRGTALRRHIYVLLVTTGTSKPVVRRREEIVTTSAAPPTPSAARALVTAGDRP